MSYQNITIIIVIITIIATIAMLTILPKKDISEQFYTPFYSYLYYPRSKFQINQVHHPFYNYPKYIGKYPYYRFMFHPYNSSVYYT